MNTIIILSILGLFSMIIGLFNINKKLVLGVIVSVLAISAGVLAAEWNTVYTFFNDMIYLDNFAIAFGVVLIFLTIIIFLLSENYFKEIHHYATEHFALLIFALTGMMLVVSFDHMAMLFIGIEIMSIPLYILAGGLKKDLRSNEASLKYFLMGSFATGLLLMGITLLYGSTGTFHIEKMSNLIIENSALAQDPILILGMIFILSGLAFKVSAAPFHFWTPDVYQGSPTLITSFMSTAVKVAGFAGFYRLFYYSFLSIQAEWSQIIAMMAILTITIGSITAVFQTSIKRILAYSSIANAGYMLLILLVSNEFSGNTLLFYGLAYSIASIAALAVISVTESVTFSDEIESFNGLAKAHPLLAFIMAVSMLSLAGIPLTGGFFAKFYVLTAGIEAGYIWLIIIAIINAIIGIYYYFKVIIAMYFRQNDSYQLHSLQVSLLFKIVLVICSLITIQLGLYPDLVYSLF